MKIERRIVTTAMAQGLLERTNFGRALDKNKVEEYCCQMRSGKWRENPSEPIAITEKDEIVNGNHRMTARLKAGEKICKPIIMWFVIGADKKDFDVIDQGKNRTAGDVLSIAGVSQGKRIAGILRRKYILDSGIIFQERQGERTPKLAKSDYLIEYQKNSDFYNQVAVFSHSLYRKNKILKTSEIGGIMGHLVLTREYELADVEEFFKGLFGNSDFAMLTQLRNILTNIALKKMPAFMGGQYKMSLIAKAWNHYSIGQDKRLKMKEDEIVKFE